MLSGVMTLVLAAATAALPFTPPAGFVQIPQTAVRGQVRNVWQGPQLPHGDRETFTAATFPFPGTASALALHERANLGVQSKTVSVKVLSNRPAMLCGVPARIVTISTRVSGKSAIVQQEVAVKNGYASMLLYNRPANAPVNAAIEQTMRGFCPSDNGTMATLPVPAGWTAAPGATVQVDGMWMGAHPGEMLMLMQGTPTSSLDNLLKDVTKTTVHSVSAKNTLEITSRTRTAMCGFPGMLATIQINADQMPVTLDMALTQGNGKAYMLSYMRMGTTPADNNALAALHTLCVTGASAAPNLTPSPAPSPAPSPTP